jgi:hypothetical protein
MASRAERSNVRAVEFKRVDDRYAYIITGALIIAGDG